MTVFYNRLFDVDPSLRALFADTDLPAQRRKLAQALTLLVAGLDDLESLVPVLDDLGARHACYGVRDEHYDTVATALLWTLEKGLGDAWTAETAAAWIEIYGIVAGVMRQAGARALAA